MRLFIVDGKEIFQLKYRYATEEKYKQFSFEEITFEEIIFEIESLLLNKFRASTLFTLNKDLIVMVSRKKAVSYRENVPSFKNKLPEIPLQS